MEKLVLKPEIPEVCYKTAVVIPSAGNSVRMGWHKALLKFNEQHNYIQKIVSVYAEAGIHNVVVVVNKDNTKAIKVGLNSKGFENVKLVLNEHPEWERFYSIKCGLAEVVDFKNCFVHNCDNPFVGIEVISKLLEGFAEDSITIPEFQGIKGHPVLLSRNIMQAVVSYSESNCNFKSFLRAFPVKIIPVDSKYILYNINSIQDYNFYNP